MEREWRDSGAVAVRLCSDSRRDSSGATVERYRCDSAVVKPLSLLYNFCSYIATAVAPAVATVLLLLLLLLSLTVVDSRGRIRVTVFIGDCQARVSSSSEGCSTSQKTFKVETY